MAQEGPNLTDRNDLGGTMVTWDREAESLVAGRVEKLLGEETWSGQHMGGVSSEGLRVSHFRIMTRVSWGHVTKRHTNLHGSQEHLPPMVLEARAWNHGVGQGCTQSSEASGRLGSEAQHHLSLPPSPHDPLLPACLFHGDGTVLRSQGSSPG